MLEQPWHVNTEPNENRQNIVLHGLIIIENVFDTFLNYALENMEEDESTGAYWMSLDSILAMDSKEQLIIKNTFYILFLNSVTN